MNRFLALGDNKTLQALVKELPFSALHLFNPLILQPLDWHTTDILWQKIQKVIIVSPNAVEFGFRKIHPTLPKACELFTIGENTAKLLETFCSQPVTYPNIFTSEALLTLPSLQQVTGQEIAIIKGQGGRTLLQETLQQRSAIVYTIDCYIRLPRTIDLTEQLKIWQQAQITHLIVTSSESLDAFMQQMPENWLKSLTLIVTSERLEKRCWEQGFEKVNRAKNFTVKCLLDVIADLSMQ